MFSGVRHKLDCWLGKIVYAHAPEANGSTLRNVESILGALFFTIGFSMISSEGKFPGWWALLPTIGTLLIIAAGPQAWFNRAVLSNKVLVWFGLVSFPLYLWHWPILSFIQIINSGTPSPEVRLSAVLLSILLAWLTYRLIEKPIRFGGHGKGKTIALVILMMITGYLGYNAYDRKGLAFRAQVKLNEKITDQYVGPMWRYTQNKFCTTKYPFNYSKEYRWWFCMASDEKNPTLVLVGNSYANQYYAGLAKNENFKHHSLLSIGDCDPMWVDEVFPVPPITPSPCSGNRQYDQMKLINDIVSSSGTVKFAILTGLQALTDKYVAALKKRIDFLEKNNVRVIIFYNHIYSDFIPRDVSQGLLQRQELIARFRQNFRLVSKMSG